jgi:hypothetical protein
MDSYLFELPGRTAQVGSRRRILGALSGGALGAFGSLLIGSNAGAKKRRKKQRKKKRTQSWNGPSAALAYECAGPGSASLLNGPTARVAQLFTATRDGSLRRIEIPVEKDGGSSGDWLIQLVRAADRTPGHEPLDVLAAVTIPDDQVPEGVSKLTGNFRGTRLDAGAEYAAVISRPGGALRHIVHVRGEKGPEVCAGSMYLASGGGEFNPGAVEMIVSVFVE